MQKNDTLHEIEIAKLRLAINIVLNKLETDARFKEAEIRNDRDFYWDLSIDDQFKTTDIPQEITIGRLRDDYEFIADMVETATDGYDAPSLMLIHVTPLLNYLRHVLST